MSRFVVKEYGDGRNAHLWQWYDPVERNLTYEEAHNAARPWRSRGRRAVVCSVPDTRSPHPALMVRECDCNECEGQTYERHERSTAEER